MFIDTSKHKNPKDENGITPLHKAAWMGYAENFELILDVVEDKNPKSDKGFTPLHVAAHFGHLDICKMIINIIFHVLIRQAVKRKRIHLINFAAT